MDQAMPPTLLAIVALGTLILGAVWQQLPKCPYCGSHRASRQRWPVARLRQCWSCGQFYDLPRD
jgi:hypothetical protein